MPNKHIKIPNGFMSVSEVDLEFEFEGKPTYMEFHRYCGPSFYTKKTAEEYEDDTSKWAEYENWLEPDDSERWKPLWESFYTWFNAPEQQYLHFKEEE